MESAIGIGTLASLIAGLGTALGALPLFALSRISARSEHALLGAAAGVMLAAVAFTLIEPAVASAPGSGFRRGLLVAVGLLLGGAIFWLVHRFLPHEHFIKGEEGPTRALQAKRLWLFVIAITLHNFPEGLAVGVGFAGGMDSGMALTAGIALQNMPEGLIVGLSLLALGYRRLTSFSVAALTGLVEPVGGFLGATAVALAAPLLPWALAFAGGAMLFVVAGEMIPETHREGHENVASAGLMAGFALMLLLDVGLA